MTQKITVRASTADDAGLLSALLNDIIAVGGSTAMETPLSIEEFQNQFLQGDDFLNCFSALNENNQPVGFQYLRTHSKLEKDWGDIATFAQLQPKVRGVGSALFAATMKWALTNNIIAINATIRADNVSGLAYYEKMGLRTYSVAKDIGLNDGTFVDRISKRIYL